MACIGVGGARRAWGILWSSWKEALGTNGLCTDQYRALVESINQQQPGAASVVAVRNSVWISDTLTPHTSFIDDVRHAFAAEVNSIDFSDPNAGKSISSWIGKHTEGLLQPTIECDGTELLSIISTVFADSHWKTPFELNNTEPAVFRLFPF